MTKYSIILRAYNVESQLKKSIDSIIEQNYKNWELIIVNDGSTDCTGTVCDEYAKKDRRIRAIHKKNGGCVLATQTGIKNATGEYICVLDAGDWYEPHYIEYVDAILQKTKVDMVVTNYYIVKPTGEKKKFYPTKKEYIVNSKMAMMNFFESTNYALWNKVVAKKLICYTEKEHNFFYKYGKTTNFGEDLYQLMPVLCNCSNVCFITECLYNYVIDDSSISHKRVENDVDELLKRNRLMQFTYETIDYHQCMSEQVRKRIQLNTVILMMPSIKRMIKRRNLARKSFEELKNNSFYKNIIRRTRFFDIKEKLGIKSAIAFWSFNKIMFLPF